ncbi:MAG TPA: DNA primase [Isosphaeraceae bacterium]|nr:DNA primase [Isosphaeraceae bacterium]
MPRHPDETLSAIKNAVDIVALVGDYVPLRRAGSKFKALCPFHDDHNPSLELNPERQSFKCWSCGAGGDVFDFIQNYEHVEFPEALRMLADRAGIVLEKPSAAAPARGPSKTELYAVNAWAEGVFARALAESGEASAYLQGRGLSRASAERFHLGYAPAARGWLLGLARRQGLGLDVLEQAGLVGRPSEGGPVRERFRGRLIFPIHDERGRTVGFGGRILPEAERALADQGKHVAKYLNTPETPLFHKRTLLYAADLARPASRQAGWVAVVEGYTDVIAAHQVGLANVVATLGTALSVDHLRGLQRLAERVVLVFDGDEAGRSAADRALELFLSHELDLRVLTLPAGVDPCDFLLKDGAGAFRALAEQAPDPLAYLLDRAAERFDVASMEGSRRAAEWVVGLVNAVPRTHGLGLDVKVDKTLDTLAQRLRLSKETLNRMRRQLGRGAVPVRSPAPTSAAAAAGPPGQGPATAAARIDPATLDRTDLELIQVVLHEPQAVAWLAGRVPVAALHSAPLQAILQACYELQAQGQSPGYETLMVRLDEPAVRGLATDLVASPGLSAPEPDPLSEGVRPAPWQERLEQILPVLAERQRQVRLADLKTALDQTDRQADPDAYRAIELEYRRLLTSGRIRRA